MSYIFNTEESTDDHLIWTDHSLMYVHLIQVQHKSALALHSLVIYDVTGDRRTLLKLLTYISLHLWHTPQKSFTHLLIITRDFITSFEHKWIILHLKSRVHLYKWVNAAYTNIQLTEVFKSFLMPKSFIFSAYLAVDASHIHDNIQDRAVKSIVASYW